MNSLDPKLRQATPADLAVVTEVTREAYSSWVSVIGREPAPMGADYQRAIAEHMIELYELDGEVLGLIELIPGQDHLVIENIAVLPKAQGRGIGDRLIRRAEAVALNLGLDEVRLYTNAAFTSNVAYYGKRGYLEFKRGPIETGGTVVHMQKALRTGSVVLIGPMGVGKSTLASLLAQRLHQPRCCFDEVKMSYLEQVGFSLKEAHDIRDSKGVFEMWRYSNAFRLQALRTFFAEHPNHVIDLGAGDHCFEEQDQIESAREMFSAFDQTVLLMPSKDLAASIRALPGVKEQRYMNTYFIMHPSNEDLCDHVLYTQNRRPAESVYELINLLS